MKVVITSRVHPVDMVKVFGFLVSKENRNDKGETLFELSGVETEVTGSAETPCVLHVTIEGDDHIEGEFESFRELALKAMEVLEDL
jgi:hypothetical protein